MVDVATHVRIFDPAPSDELVEKRATAIKEIGEKLFKKRSAVDDLLQLANDTAASILGKGKLNDGIAGDVEAAIKKQSQAFVRAGHDLEINTCLQISILDLVEGAKPSNGPLTKADVLAAGLWSALSFQARRSDAKVEALRGELLEVSRTLAEASGKGARRRQRVPGFAAIAEAADIPALNKAFKPGTDPTIDALRANAALDREEIDLLWWVTGDWSEIASQRLSDLPMIVAVVMGGVEMGRILRKLPIEAHRALALRNAGSSATQVSLAEVIAALGEWRQKLLPILAENTTLASCPAVFPLLDAIHSGKAMAPNSKEKRSVRAWGARALLEASLLFVKHDDDGL